MKPDTFSAASVRSRDIFCFCLISKIMRMPVSKWMKTVLILPRPLTSIIRFSGVSNSASNQNNPWFWVWSSHHSLMLTAASFSTMVTSLGHFSNVLMSSVMMPDAVVHLLPLTMLMPWFKTATNSRTKEEELVSNPRTKCTIFRILARWILKFNWRFFFNFESIWNCLVFLSLNILHTQKDLLAMAILQ